MLPIRISSSTRARAGLVVITALITLGLAPRDGQAQTFPTRVLLLGDSITNGKGVSAQEYYPGLLRDWLGADYEIIEEGCGGTTSALWSPLAVDLGPCHGFLFYLYDRYAFGNLPAEIVTLLLGTNDALRSESLEGYEENIIDIVDALLDDGAETVVLMPPPRLPREFSLAKRLAVKQFGDFVLDLCSNTNHVVCGPDLFELLEYPYQGTGEDHFQNRPSGLDDLHPNAAGHEVIANRLYDTIVNLPEPIPWDDPDSTVTETPEPGAGLLQLGALITLVVLRRVRYRDG